MCTMCQRASASPRMMEMEVCPDETQEHCDSSSTENHCQAANSWNTTQLKSIHKHSKNESSCWMAQHGALKRSCSVRGKMNSMLSCVSNTPCKERRTRNMQSGRYGGL